MKGVSAVLLPMACMLPVWLLLTAGSTASLIIGVPTIILAWLVWRRLPGLLAEPGVEVAGEQSSTQDNRALVNQELPNNGKENSGRRLFLRGLLKFLPFFLTQLVTGGIAVAKQILKTTESTTHGFFWFHSRITCPHAQLTLVYCINLLPGTVVVRRDGNALELHALQTGSVAIKEVADLEDRIAALFPGCVSAC